MIAERLKSARKSMGWSQKELAFHSGVKRPIIGRYETGVSSPGPENLKKLATVLKKSPDFFVAKKSIQAQDLSTPDEAVELDIELNKMLKAVKDFSTADKKVIAGMINIILNKNRISSYMKNAQDLADR